MKFARLQPGMLVESYGLILEVHNEPDEFFTDTGHIAFIGEDDPYWGRCTCAVTEDSEFTLTYLQGTEEYYRTVWSMVNQRRQALEDVNKDIKELINYAMPHQQEDFNAD